MQHTRTPSVLLIEDNLPIRKMLSIALDSVGYEVVECANGEEGLQLAATVKPGLILLDLGLPDMPGQQLISEIREWSQIPIIVCSGRTTDAEVVRALEAGADDYITKPFNTDVLIARIRANLRKVTNSEVMEPELVNGRIHMDLLRHAVYLDGKKAVFTPKEYALLRYFLTHRGKMLSHRQILKDLWGNTHANDTQYLRVYISQLRDKIEPDIARPHYIVTESGIGYRMENVTTDSKLSLVTVG